MQHGRDEMVPDGRKDGAMSGFGEPESAALRLKRAEHVLRAALASTLRQEDLGFEHGQVLAALLQWPGLRMTELAEAAVLPAATLTRHVDKLVSRALVIRRIDPEDKRRVAVALSQRGTELAARLRDLERATTPSTADVLAR